MIYENKTLQEWQERYPSLEIVQDSCDNCSAKLMSTLPFRDHGIVGLINPKCSCGKSTRQLVSTFPLNKT